MTKWLSPLPARSAAAGRSREELDHDELRAGLAAEAASGESAADVHVMGRLAAAYEYGPERFLRELLQQPGIATAVANSTRQDS